MRWIPHGLIAVTILFVSSCGQKEITLPETGATLTGTIKSGDEPVQFALVIVEGGGKSATGKVGDDGRYLVTNAPLGEVSVAVNTDAATGDFQSAAMSAGAYKGPDAKGKKKVDVKFVKVPTKYSAIATSGLKTTVAVGSNTFDIALTK